jgi:hypothetical protein
VLVVEQFECLHEAFLFTNKLVYLYLTLVCALGFAELWDDEVFTFVFALSASSQLTITSFAAVPNSAMAIRQHATSREALQCSVTELQAELKPSCSKL